MSCFNEEQIQYYLDNEYGVEKKGIIRHHLEHCPLCRKTLEYQRQRALELKQSLDLLVTEQADIPDFKPPVTSLSRRKISTQYILPLAVAASLLLIVLLRSFFLADKLPFDSQGVQFMVSGELDANKTITEYPLIITIVAPDGSISQKTIN